MWLTTGHMCCCQTFDLAAQSHMHMHGGCRVNPIRAPGKCLPYGKDVVVEGAGPGLDGDDSPHEIAYLLEEWRAGLSPVLGVGEPCRTLAVYVNGRGGRALRRGMPFWTRRITMHERKRRES